MAKYVLSERSARRIKELLGSGGKRGAMVYRPELSFADKPHPFEVRWSQTEYEKGGSGWVVNLTALAKMVKFNGEYIGFEDIGDQTELPGTWYPLPETEETEDTLHVDVVKNNDDEYVAKFSWNSEESDEAEARVKIAEIYVRDDGSRNVRSIVTSALILGGGESEKVESWKFGRFALGKDEDGNFVKIKNCIYRIGGITHDMGSVDYSPSSGILALVISLSYASGGGAGSAEFTEYEDVAELQDDEKDDSKYILPLYTIADGKVTVDWRIGVDAAMWES